MSLKTSLSYLLLAALASLTACQQCAPGQGEPYVNKAGDSYALVCDTSFDGRVQGFNIEPNTFGACIDACSAYSRVPGHEECTGVE